MKSRTAGFTLIEILVVMVIAAAGISLVAPRLIGTYEKIRAYSEEQKLLDIIEAVRMRSFLRQVPQAIELKDNGLGLKNKDVRVGFEYISFPEATITFNGNGFPDTHALRYLVQGREKVLNVL